jgi:hypothetical protein
MSFLDFIKTAKTNSFVIKVLQVYCSNKLHTLPVCARREGDVHCKAGESTPVDNLATRVAGRARRRASRLTPCGWREHQPLSRSAMARTKWCHTRQLQRRLTHSRWSSGTRSVQQQDAANGLAGR